MPTAELYQWIFSPLNILNYIFLYFYFKDQAHYGDTYLTYSMWWRDFDTFMYEEVALIPRAIMNQDLTFRFGQKDFPLNSDDISNTFLLAWVMLPFEATFALFFFS